MAATEQSLPAAAGPLVAASAAIAAAAAAEQPGPSVHQNSSIGR